VKKTYEVVLRRKGGNMRLTFEVDANSDTHAQRLAIRRAITENAPDSKPAQWSLVSAKEVRV
jgi:hypothetical protein